MSCKRLAERDTRERALAHQVVGALGHADRAHAVVDASRAESRLRDREAAPFFTKQIGNGNADVLVFDLAVPAAVVVPEHRQRAHDPHTRRIERNEDHRLAPILIGIGVGHAHYDRDLATRIRGAGGPPLARVDHVVIAFAHDPSLDVARVGRRDFGFGHREARADLAFQERLQPRVALLVGSVLGEDLHVPRVGCGTVQGLGRDVRASTGDLGKGRVLEVR